MHDRVFPQAATTDPNVLATVGEAWGFLRLPADSTGAEPVLTGELVNRDGQRFLRQELRAGDLRARQGSDRLKTGPPMT